MVCKSCSCFIEETRKFSFPAIAFKVHYNTQRYKNSTIHTFEVASEGSLIQGLCYRYNFWVR